MFLLLPKLKPYASLLSLFSELNQNEWEKFRICEFSPRQHIIEEGTTTPANLYLILKGVCEVTKRRHEDDSYFSPYKICAGEITGLRELLSDIPSKHFVTVSAKTPVTALEIEGSSFLEWREKYGKTYNRVIYAVLSQQFTTRRLMINCIMKDSLAAGAYYFSVLYELYRDSCYGKNHTESVKLWDTRAEIAVSIGRNVRSVDRIISTLQEKQCITLSKGKIYVNLQQYENLKHLF